MKNFWKNKSGLVLAEALIAIAILGIGVIAAGSMINTAVSTTTISRNYLIAHNLANEGVEAVKAIRNANWLNKPNNPECWLAMGKTDDIIDPLYPLSEVKCTSDSQINIVENHRYWMIDQRNDNIWTLKPGSPPKELDIGSTNSSVKQANEHWQLEVDVNPSSVTKGKYISKFSKTTSNDVEKSIFYRNVEFLYIVPNEMVSFKVKVQWFEGKKIRTVEQDAVLYNSK